jgi:hypothetical protein
VWPAHEPQSKASARATCWRVRTYPPVRVAHFLRRAPTPKRRISDAAPAPAPRGVPENVGIVFAQRRPASMGGALSTWQSRGLPQALLPVFPACRSPKVLHPQHHAPFQTGGRCPPRPPTRWWQRHVEHKPGPTRPCRPDAPRRGPASINLSGSHHPEAGLTQPAAKRGPYADPSNNTPPKPAAWTLPPQPPLPQNTAARGFTWHGATQPRPTKVLWDPSAFPTGPLHADFGVARLVACPPPWQRRAAARVAPQPHAKHRLL